MTDVKEYLKTYYKDNKEEYNKKGICDYCNCEIILRNIKIHKKSKKCRIKQIEKNNENIDIDILNLLSKLTDMPLIISDMDITQKMNLLTNLKTLTQL